MKKRQGFFSAGFALLSTTLILTLVGLLFVFEASVSESFTTFGDQYALLRQQASRFAIGWLVLVTTLFIPIKIWRLAAPVGFLAALIGQLLVFVPGIGLKLNAASRWISIAGLRLQPVELTKLMLVIFFASWLRKHQRLGPFLTFTLIPVLLTFLQPDLGSTLILMIIAFGLFFVAGGKLRPFIGLTGLSILFITAAIVMKPYRLNRLKTFLNPELDPLGKSFHIRQITLALGNGGWFGQGIGNSRQKFSYIPEASSDSLFAIVAEEIGFIGSLGLLSLYFFYLYSGYKVAAKAPTNSFKQLLVIGILLWIGGQTLLNLSAIVALVPLTGLPLPFLSLGGTSLIMTLFATGLMVRVAKEN